MEEEHKMEWLKEQGQKNKHNTEKLKIEQNEPHQKLGWTQVLRMGKLFLLQ